MGATFFKTRNFDEHFKKTTIEFPMNRFNLEKISAADLDRAKRGNLSAGKSSDVVRKASSLSGYE